MDRRGFLGVMLAACAAPAVVRASSLMRVAAPKILVPEMVIWTLDRFTVYQSPLEADTVGAHFHKFWHQEKQLRVKRVEPFDVYLDPNQDFDIRPGKVWRVEEAVDLGGKFLGQAWFDDRVTTFRAGTPAELRRAIADYVSLHASPAVLR